MTAAKNRAAHTRTSILRMSASRGDLNGWLLPETRKMLESQLRKSAEACYDVRRIEMQKKFQQKRKPKIRTNPLNVSNSIWLKKNSLVARKLTLMDALAPTIIRRTRKYIPVLDTYVNSKVFDDILPIAHVTGSGSNKNLTLVNPDAVDLYAYQRKLRAVVEEYTTRLNAIITRCLPAEERQSFDNELVSYFSNKEGVHQALDNSGWPISEKEISLLVDEVYLGERYLRQSREVQELSKQALEDLKNKKPHGTARTSRAQAGRKQSDEKSGGGKRKAKLPQPSSSSGSRSTDSSSQSSDKSSSGSSDDNEEKEEEEESSRKDDESDDDVSEVSSKVRKPTGKAKKKTKKDKKRQHSCKGMKVIARDGDDGFYYKAKITSRKDNRHYLVEFEHTGTVASVSNRYVIHQSGAVACPRLKVGDYALCLSRNNDADVFCYVPAMVIGTPLKTQIRDKFYTVLKYDNSKDDLMRRQLIKIAPSDYQFALRYVRFAQKIDRNVPSVDFVTADASKSELYKMVETSLAGVSGRFENIDEKIDKNTEQQLKHRTLLEKLYKRILKGKEEDFNKLREEIKTERDKLNERLDQHKGDLSAAIESTLVAQHEARRREEELQRETAAATAAAAAAASELSTAKSTEETTSTSRSSSSGDEDKTTVLEKSCQTGTVTETTASSSAEEEQDDKTATDLERTSAGATTMMEDTTEKEKSSVDDKSSAATTSFTSESEENEKDKENDKEDQDASMGSEVLARDQNSGWYYRGTIAGGADDREQQMFRVSNCAGHIKNTRRRDVITDEDDAASDITVGDHVLAVHPYLAGWYGPALVHTCKNGKFNVAHFDGTTSALDREQIFMISTDKYTEIARSIDRCRSRWIGETVVARDDSSGYFQLGFCKKLVSNYSYELMWSDGSVSVQESPYVYGALSDRTICQPGDHVIAMCDHRKLKYLPGCIITGEDGESVIEFCDHTRLKWLHDDDKFAYLISSESYGQLSAFFNHRQRLVTATGLK